MLLTLEHYFFGAIKLTINADPDKYKYSSYGIGLDANGSFSLSDGSESGKKVIIFGSNMSSSVRIDNKKKDILVLGKGQTQGLKYSTLTTKKENAINFTEQQKKFRLRLHHNWVNSYIFVNGVRIYKSKAKDSEINAAPICLDNVSKDFSADNMKNTGMCL